MLVAGQRVRHRKQAAWGIGVVESVKAGALVELVIAFPDGARTLKLKPEIVETMIEVLSADDNAAVDAQEAKAAAAAAAEAKARTKRMKATKLAPTSRMEVNCLSLIDTGDGNVMLALADLGVLRVCSADGAILEDIELPDPGAYTTFSPGAHFVPTQMITDGHGLVAGTRTHNWGDLVFARRGQPARMWRAAFDVGIMKTSILPGGGAVISDRAQVVLVREDGSFHQVPLSLGKRHVDSAEAWHDGVLLGVNGEGDDHYFRYQYVGLDGTARHEGIGGAPVPLDDELMLSFAPDFVYARTRDGTIAGTLSKFTSSGNIASDPTARFVRVDDELVFSLGMGAGFVRWHPRVDQPRWVRRLDTPDLSLMPPVRIGRFVAATHSAYAEPELPRVWVVDLESGALVHTFDLKKPVSQLLPVGDDTLVARAYSKQPVAWRGLSTSTPERFALDHPSQCSDAVSPLPGRVVTVDVDGVSFFAL